MNDDTEARLRAALAARADSVEPATGADMVPALAARTDGARRRLARQRILLSVAAVVAVVAAITGIAVLADDDPSTDLATAGDTTTSAPSTSAPAPTTTEGAVPPGFAALPAIWPLPTMSLTYSLPEDAVTGLLTGYLGADVSHCVPSAVGVPDGIDVTWACNFDGVVHLRDDGVRGLVVVGVDSELGDFTAPAQGATTSLPLTVAVGQSASVDAELRPVGSLDSIDSGTIPAGGGSLELGTAEDAPGEYVLVATSGTHLSIRTLHLTAPTTTTTTPTTAPPTTTTTAPPTDDGTVGWEATGEASSTPEAAAAAFADEVLGFADTTVVGSGGEDDRFVTLRNRPGAGAETTVQVHDSGTARGWVVVGATSNQGRIDSPLPGESVDLPIRITGEATAFEATVAVRLLTISGTAFAESNTMAGANGEQGPFDTTIDADPAGNPAGGPTFVLIGEGDASGEGDLTWAALVLVDL